MTTELTDDEKKRLADEARQLLAPVAAKYELDYALGFDALFEAFQVGIRFTIDQTKKAQEDVLNG